MAWKIDRNLIAVAEAATFESGVYFLPSDVRLVDLGPCDVYVAYSKGCIVVAQFTGEKLEVKEVVFESTFTNCASIEDQEDAEEPSPSPEQE